MATYCAFNLPRCMLTCFPTAKQGMPCLALCRALYSELSVTVAGN